jgi:hypothetical protein
MSQLDNDSPGIFCTPRFGLKAVQAIVQACTTTSTAVKQKMEDKSAAWFCDLVLVKIAIVTAIDTAM